jgi:hypothetical protein
MPFFILPPSSTATIRSNSLPSRTFTCQNHSTPFCCSSFLVDPIQQSQRLLHPSVLSIFLPAACRYFIWVICPMSISTQTKYGETSFHFTFHFYSSPIFLKFLIFWQPYTGVSIYSADCKRCPSLKYEGPKNMSKSHYEDIGISVNNEILCICNTYANEVIA